ncbi:MAG: SMI1/KNR4 family protein, partial [Clostridiales Family XIII bacterium]|jgi:hypothetical protein|nr:SMI1/KNR4 family protein [Clostridiales Family XIII bacterium]
LSTVSDDFEKCEIDELSAFRFVNNRPFPSSYKDFSQVYGYGISCGEFIIYVPMGHYCDSFIFQSEVIKNTYADLLYKRADVWFPLGPDVNFEILRCLVPFSKSENGNYLFWDIDSGYDEMDIYITDFRGLGFIKAARDLYEFFDKVTSQERYNEVFPKLYGSPLPSTFRSLKKVL